MRLMLGSVDGVAHIVCSLNCVGRIFTIYRFEYNKIEIMLLTDGLVYGLLSFQLLMFLLAFFKERYLTFDAYLRHTPSPVLEEKCLKHFC